MTYGPEPTWLIVPGLDNSGPGHWQSIWEAERASCQRVEFGCWSDPDPAVWTRRLAEAVAASPASVVLIAHSLGCLAVAHWAAGTPVDRAKIKGALLVAPPNVDDPEALPVVRRFAPAPRQALPFRSLLVASRDDPYASFAASRDMAAMWGSGLFDAGACGHINAASSLGDWPVGRKLLAGLAETARTEA